MLREALIKPQLFFVIKLLELLELSLGIGVYLIDSILLSSFLVLQSLLSLTELLVEPLNLLLEYLLLLC